MNPNNFLRIRNRNAVSIRFFDFFLWRCTMKKFLLILFAAFLLCACLPVGAEPFPDMSMRIINPKKDKIRQGEDLEVTITYGISPASYYYEDDIMETSVNATFQMASYVYDKNGKDRTLYAENLQTMNNEQFRAKHDPSPEKDYFGITDTVVIPHDWFAGEKGVIVFRAECVIHNLYKEYNRLFEDVSGNGKSLYYIKRGKNIILFYNYYDYQNYHKIPEEMKPKLYFAIAATAVAIPVVFFTVRWSVKTKKKEKNHE